MNDRERETREELAVLDLAAEASSLPHAAPVNHARLREAVADRVVVAPVERRLWVARRRVLWASCGLAAAAVVGVFALRPRPTAPELGAVRVVASQGEVVHELRGHREPLPAVGAVLTARGRIESLRDGRVVLETGDGIGLEVAERTELNLEGLDSTQSAQTVELLAGSLFCHVSSRPPGHAFTVITPDARVVVHGTAFRVTVREEGSMPSRTCVRVDDGVVAVHSAAGATELRSGESWNCEHRTVAPASARAKSEAAPAQPAQPAAPTSAGASPHSGTSNSELLVLQNELFRAAVAAEKRGDPTTAAAKYAELLRRFPDSPLAAEARLGALRVRRPQ